MKKLGKSNSTTRMLLGPYSAWAAIFIIVPLLFIAYYAFTDNNFNFLHLFFRDDFGHCLLYNVMDLHPFKCPVKKTHQGVPWCHSG